MKPGRQQLSAWIARHDFTGRTAARVIDLHWAHLSQIINGHRVPGLMVAVRIERATGIPVESWLPTSVGKSSRQNHDTSAKANEGNAVTENV